MSALESECYADVQTSTLSSQQYSSRTCKLTFCSTRNHLVLTNMALAACAHRAIAHYFSCIDQGSLAWYSTRPCAPTHSMQTLPSTWKTQSAFWLQTPLPNMLAARALPTTCLLVLDLTSPDTGLRQRDL